MAVSNEFLAVQNAMAERYADQLSSVLSTEMQRMLRTYRITGTAIHADEHVVIMGTILRALWKDTINAVGRVDNLVDIKSEDAEFLEEVLRRYIEAYGQIRISQISLATHKQIQEAIHTGLRKGESIDEVVARLQETAPQLSRLRSEVIARTEVHSAAIFTSMESAKASPFELLKEWASADDHRTRDFGEGSETTNEFNHRVMDGVAVPMDAKFLVPHKLGFTEALDFPGDPNGSASNIIRCRCALTYERA